MSCVCDVSHVDAISNFYDYIIDSCKIAMTVHIPHTNSTGRKVKVIPGWDYETDCAREESCLPKINYCDRLCTLCHKHDIQDEYHALMICSRYESLRKKYLKPYYYKRPSVYKFIQLMNTVNKREQFRLMIFTKLLMKDFNCTL